MLVPIDCPSRLRGSGDRSCVAYCLLEELPAELGAGSGCDGDEIGEGGNGRSAD